MIGLLIADDSDITLRVKSIFSEMDCELICYSLFIKALDNLEEINPDYVIISAVEFPRQWKMLCQYSKGLNGLHFRTILLVDENFSEDEKRKAKCLEVYRVLDVNETNENLLKQISEIKHEKCSVEIIINDLTANRMITGNSVLKDGCVIFTSNKNDLYEDHEVIISCRLNGKMKNVRTKINNTNGNNVRIPLEDLK